MGGVTPSSPTVKSSLWSYRRKKCIWNLKVPGGGLAVTCMSCPAHWMLLSGEPHYYFSHLFFLLQRITTKVKYTQRLLWRFGSVCYSKNSRLSKCEQRRRCLEGGPQTTVTVLEEWASVLTCFKTQVLLPVKRWRGLSSLVNLESAEHLQCSNCGDAELPLGLVERLMCGNCTRDFDTKGEQRKGSEDERLENRVLNTADQIRHRRKQRGDGRGTCDGLRHKEKGQICRFVAQEHKCKQTTENYYEPYSRLFRSHGDKIITKNISISKETKNN